MEEYYEEQLSDAERVSEEEPADWDEGYGEQFLDEEREPEGASADEGDELAPEIVTMGDLLGEAETPLFTRPKRGQVVDGVIVQIDSGAILVDIGAKLDGFIHPNEVEQLQRDPENWPQVGDQVLVYVIQPANKDGHAVLSLSRAQAERDWRVAQEQFEKGEVLSLQVMGYNKGGLIVRLGEVRGFVPATQLDQRIPSNNRMEDRMKRLSKTVGQDLKLKIIELDRSSNRLILSERLAMREWREQERIRLLDELREGETRRGRVSGLAEFGAFVDIGGADGLVHLSELSWDQVPHPRDAVRVGDEVDVYVLNVDRERKRIALSIKRTKSEPWSNIHQRYQIGQKITGQVTKLASFGAFVRLEEGVEGLAHISELSMHRIQHPKEVVQEGEEYEFRIIRIDSARRRMRLSLKQLEEEVADQEAEVEWIDEDVPTPKALARDRRHRRREEAPVVEQPPAVAEEDLAEWQEQLRQLKRAMPAAPVKGAKAPAQVAEEPAEEPVEPVRAVVEVPDVPKAVVEVPDEPKAVVEVPVEEPTDEAAKPAAEAVEPADEAAGVPTETSVVESEDIADQPVSDE